MKNSIFIAATAACALSVGHPAAAQSVVMSRPAVVMSGPVTHSGVRLAARDAAATVLYDQTANPSGVGLLSQKFEPAFKVDNSQIADDFTVPSGTSWTVSEVDVIGAYDGGTTTATSENVFFYKSKKGLPGAKVASFKAVKGTDTTGSFAITLPQTVKLSAGTYFVSVQINMPFNGSGGPTDWLWETNKPGGTKFGKPAVFENPLNGTQTGCVTWTVTTTCGNGGQGAGQLFTILGQTPSK